ncbi:MAG: hypothetical protein AB1749_11090 [Pseudomonadota bacterium]
MAFDPARVVGDYGDIEGEVEACRTAAALFDFSFVARARVTGPIALASLARLTARELDTMAVGDIRYAVRAGPDGHLLSDLTIWRLAPDTYELMSGRREDIADLVRLAPPGTAVDLSGESAILALQGPASLTRLAKATDVSAIARLAYYRCCRTLVLDADCLVGRLGYTGEAGFEIIVAAGEAPRLWAALSRIAKPAGFAAADILRIEAGFVLFANELRLRVGAGDVGLSAFAGATPAHLGPPLTLVAFRADAAERPVLWQPAATLAPPGPGQLVVTSACWSRRAGGVLGLGFVHASDAESGRPLADPDQVFTNIALVPRPFYDPGKRRPRAEW